VKSEGGGKKSLKKWISKSRFRSWLSCSCSPFSSSQVKMKHFFRRLPDFFGTPYQNGKKIQKNIKNTK
jgi:hypothetical protein